MKRPLRTLVILLTVVIFVRPGNGCGPFFDEDVFRQTTDPDAPYAKFVAGRLGLLDGDYRIRHLVIAYNTLSGRGLTAVEQKAAIDVDSYYNNGNYAEPGANVAPGVYVSGPNGQSKNPGPAQAEWDDADVERKVPGQDYDTFTNCLDDAFANASATLADRRSHYKKPGQLEPPEITDWIAGQKAVFSNCSGPGQAPQPAPANAPLWLRQDRAYQTAAAAFYALDYSTALADFRAIAADHSSPWAQLARYLVARTLIRQATVNYVPFSTDPMTPEQTAANNAKMLKQLAEARTQLDSILGDPDMKQLHRASDRLLDFVMARLDPTTQADILARRLAERPRNSTDPDYLQNVIDLSYIYNSLPAYAPMLSRKDALARDAVNPPAPLIRWLNDMGRSRPRVVLRDPTEPMSVIATNRQSDALAAWRQTHGAQWLVAALTTVEPGDDANPDLIAAAQALPADSPAWASVTYHRLRLATTPKAPSEHVSSSTAPAYAELAALMPRIEQSQPRSTINAFADLESSLAITFNDFLKSSTRIATGLSDDGSGESEPLTTPEQPVTLCNVEVNAPNARHLDEETAVVFNQRMPLHMLRDAALSPALPANVRFEVAHMAWTRALLLDDPDTARVLSPYLSGCQAAFKQWLDQYNAASTPDERHVLGLLALMRFASTEPNVRVGLERDFAAYSEYRDNWWCSEPDWNVQNLPVAKRPALLFSQAVVPRIQQPDPPFLSDADRATVDGELAKLEKIPSASDYLAEQALDWVNRHPADPHDADLLGFATRVVRNACRSDATKELNHQLFDLLHRRFPKSEWATRYTTWE
jgi:hypothetical protein